MGEGQQNRIPESRSPHSKRAQLVRQDAYGRPQLEKWKEVEYFIDNHISPSLTPR